MILKDKVAIVTGASRGVGAAIAKVLAGEGAAVCVNYFRSESKAMEVVDTIKKKGRRGVGLLCRCYQGQ